MNVPGRRQQRTKPVRRPGPRGTAEHVSIGKVVGVFGLEGALKVQVYSDFPERFDPGSVVYIEGEAFTIHKTHWHKSQARVLLKGVLDATQAEPFIGKSMTVVRSERPELDRDEFYLDELIGMAVVDEDGKPLGTVDEVIANPGQEVIRVGEIMFPAAKQFVRRVDVKGKRMVVRLIPGMADPDQAEEAR